MRIAANLAKARRSFGTRLIRSPRRRGRAPKPDRRPRSSRGTLPPGPRSRLRKEYLAHVYQPRSSNLWGESSGTVLATRSALNGSNRPVPRARTPAQETVVRRAVAPAYARALRGNLDRR